MSSLTATTREDRILELDVMRGFALFGILIVNMQFFGLPFYTVISDMNPFNDPADLASRFFIGVFFEGKFITLFSFLFGLGFWIFVSRARAKGRTAGPLFLRRLLILGIFGAAHAFLFWAGDILLFYALLGLIMMIFLNRTDKTLKVWIVLLPVLHVLLIAAFVGLFQMALNIPEAAEGIQAGLDEARAEMEALAVSAMEIYRSGSFSEMMQIRRQELAFAWQGFIMGGIGVFYLLAVFLAGMYAGRRDWFQSVPEKLPGLRRRVPWLLLVGLACAIPGYLIMRGADVITPGWNMPLYLALFILGSPALISAYVILLLDAYHRFGQSRLWIYLRDAGRMSLTVYLMQTLVMTTLFNSYGFGLYGQVPVWMMLVISVVFFGIQMMAAHWWMKRFLMGPFEWLWRAATYGYLPALKKGPVSDGPAA